MAKTQETMEISRAPQQNVGTMDVELVTPFGHNGSNSLAIKQVTPADFEPDALTSIYRTMLLSRRLDEKMVTLLKQGKGFFHIGCAGHEAAQAAVACFSRPGHDWFVPYYRDLCMTLSLGMTSKDMLLAHMAKADDPNSGGRQMAEHFFIARTQYHNHVIIRRRSISFRHSALQWPCNAAKKTVMSYVSSGDGANVSR